MSEDTLYKVISGEIVINERGVFYFSEPGNWFSKESGPRWEKLHRVGGPAIEYRDGGWEWWRNGREHRDDGPAISYDGSYSWYVNGKLLTQTEFIILKGTNGL